MRKAGIAAGWALAAAIVWLSLTPSPPSVEVSDKLGHFAAYGALMFWFCWLYRERRARTGCAVGFIALGIGLEFAKGALGSRHFELYDMAANTAGVLGGWAAAALVQRLRAA